MLDFNNSLVVVLPFSRVKFRPQHHGIRPREEVPTGLPLRRASVPLSYTTLHDQRQSNVESLAARICRWEVLRCPTVPKAERFVEFTFVQVENF